MYFHLTIRNFNGSSNFEEIGSHPSNTYLFQGGIQGDGKENEVQYSLARDNIQHACQTHISCS